MYDIRIEILQNGLLFSNFLFHNNWQLNYIFFSYKMWVGLAWEDDSVICIIYSEPTESEVQLQYEDVLRLLFVEKYSLVPDKTQFSNEIQFLSPKTWHLNYNSCLMKMTPIYFPEADIMDVFRDIRTFYRFSLTH